MLFQVDNGLVLIVVQKLCTKVFYQKQNKLIILTIKIMNYTKFNAHLMFY